MSYVGKIVPFGETILWRLPLGRVVKAHGVWHRGLWLGRTETSDEHIVATPQGIERVRAIRRLVMENCHDIKTAMEARGLPWNSRAGAIQARRGQ